MEKNLLDDGIGRNLRISRHDECVHIVIGPGDYEICTWAARTHHEMQCFLATTEGLQIHTTFEVDDSGGLGRS